MLAPRLLIFPGSAIYFKEQQPEDVSQHVLHHLRALSTNRHTDTKQNIRPCPNHLERRTRFPRAVCHRYSPRKRAGDVAAVGSKPLLVTQKWNSDDASASPSLPSSPESAAEQFQSVRVRVIQFLTI
ncbi:uncharacterized protein LOC141728445 isoform X2 [Zonotrichia albicollis]|uniref:uncharacterized protein LOC141728445 isoform X2 n=1 Tax=Zonotrichia albicollis TaxID=44394 RepID=UPI003D80D151